MLVCWVVLGLCLSPTKAVFAGVSPDGTMTKVYVKDKVVAENVVMKVALPDWKKVVPFSEGKILNKKVTSNESIFDGILYLTKKQKLYFTEDVSQGKDITKFDFAIRNTAEIQMAGIFFYFYLPVSTYRDCKVTCAPGQKGKNSFVLPATLDPKSNIIARTRAKKIIFTNPNQKLDWELVLSPATSVQIQDERKYGKEYFTVLVTLRYNDMPAEQFIRFAAQFQGRTEEKVTAPPAAKVAPAPEKPATAGPKPEAPEKKGDKPATDTGPKKGAAKDKKDVDKKQ